MDRVRFVLLAVLLAAPAAVAAPHKKSAASKPVPKPAPAEPGMADPETTPEGAPGPATQHNEGDYGGVAPGQPARPEPTKGKAKKPVPKGTLAWIGFEAKAGGADIFFQSPGAFELTQRVENGVLVINLAGLTKLGANTWRPIDARFFDSPIARIAASRVGATKGKAAHGAGLEVRITFKNPKDAHEGQFRSATEADGNYYAYLTFAGSGAAPAEPEK